VIGSEIHFELLLPEKWNGKFVFGGGGGFVGSVVNLAASLYSAVQSGYATVGTDTGHQAHSLDASWALNNMERVVNFGHLAVHRTAVTAKALTQSYYQQDIARNYFLGCSRGGGQALMEAQRYPEDFEGIVAGAPAYNWSMAMGAAMTQVTQVMYPDPNDLHEAVVGPKQLELIESSYLEVCDDLDGIKDGILADPRQCAFDVSSLLCKTKKSDSCLSKQQLDAVKSVYAGPRDSKGNAMYYSLPFGAETSAGGWPMYVTGGLKYHANVEQVGLGSDFPTPVLPSGQYGFSTNFMKYLVYHDPNWTYKNFKFDSFAEDVKLVANTLNATNSDLSAFRKRNGKLLLFHGWSDAVLSAQGTIAYYDNVLGRDKTAANDVRLFMMPGVEHCWGGVGPSAVNYLNVLDEWVESGKAPEQTAAYWLDEKFQPSGSRLLCAYPNIAKYDGKGDTRDASSFSCVSPD
jgi:feruloyl esterase